MKRELSTTVPVTIITDHEDKNPVQIIGFDREAITETLNQLKEQ